MSNKPNQNVLQFPTDFRLRVFGLDADDFVILVMLIVRRHVPELNEDGIDTRPSHGGKYISVRVNFIAESREQLDAIYRDLNAEERVLFVL